MGNGRSDSFLIEFSEPTRIPYGSKSKRKMPPRPFPFKFERKWNTSFLSLVSLGMMGHQLKAPLEYYNAMMVRWVSSGCPQLGTHDCRVMPVSRTAVLLTVVVFPVFTKKSLNNFSKEFSEILWKIFPKFFGKKKVIKPTAFREASSSLHH